MKKVNILAFASLVLISASSPILAQITTPQQTAELQEREGAVTKDAGVLDDTTPGTNLRVSKLIGMNIQNPQGENVGSIHDVVLDTRTGKISYAAVTYGGFLGFGNKLFAVPFEAFKVQADVSSSARTTRVSTEDDYVLVLNVTQEQLEGQQGFDEEHWPNFADKQWISQLDRIYNINRSQTPTNPRAQSPDGVLPNTGR